MKYNMAGINDRKRIYKINTGIKKILNYFNPIRLTSKAMSSPAIIRLSKMNKLSWIISLPLPLEN